MGIKWYCDICEKSIGEEAALGTMLMCGVFVGFAMAIIIIGISGVK